MDSLSHARGRGRGGQIHSRNRQWVANENGQRSGSSTPYHSDGERWERGGHRGGHRGRGISRGRGKFSNVSLRVANPVSTPSHVELVPATISPDEEMDELEEAHVIDEGFEESEEPVLETPEEREKFYHALVKARDVERKKAIAEGKMDDPSVAKRLEDAITVVGTCMDMCPRFERYRRERENNLFQWETIPGTKRVDHKRAVKMYERAAGDKTLPSDLRPPPILKKTLDYLFHNLLPRGGFSATHDFIRDRSRAVRNDFTMQHSYGQEAIECHDRCARFHILALHLERDTAHFSIPLEEQQLMNTLQSLKEFYQEQRGRYESPTELEMRVYHRLIHIRDQKERHEDIPEHISSHPVFKLTTEFRLHVQRKSAPINKNSVLKVDDDGMQIFGNLANVLREQGSVVMIYLVACILERLFGKDAIDDIDAIRGDLSISNIIDGKPPSVQEYEEEQHEEYEENEEYEEHENDDGSLILTEDEAEPIMDPSLPISNINTVASSVSPFGGSTTIPPVHPPLPAASAFSTLTSTPNVFNTPSPFGGSGFLSSSTPLFGIPATSAFGKPAPPTNASTTSAPSTRVFETTKHSLSTPTPIPSSPAASTFGSNSNNQDSFVAIPFAQSTKDTLPPLFNPVLPAAKPFPPGPGIFMKPVTSGVDESESTAPRVPATSTLNPLVAPFTPSFAPKTTTTTAPLDEIPAGRLFQRSSNPSPSPLPPDKNAPPTPAPPVSSSTSFVPSTLSSSTPQVDLPPTQRTFNTPPILLKINTNTSSNFERPLDTPTVPPPLPKLQPISLPSTPTVAPPPKTILNFFKGNLATPTSSVNQEMLSPLFMPSPTTSGLHEFPFNRRSSAKGSAEQPAGLLLNLNGEGKPSAKQIDEEGMENKSIQFARRSGIVKSCLRRWHQRIIERVAWIEACQQSDAYKEKIKHQRPHPIHPDKKRRISAGPNTVVDSHIKKRARRRVSSGYQPPRTDEDLAQRFKENHEEHERRWAQGSFLKAITNHVKSKLIGSLPHPSWRIWLSMNLDSDATAIWLERKFDVPASGKWVSEAVFSIPLTETTDPDSPGIIVFECTPLEGVTDELERKYRVLDDCARLRDIIQAFPSGRHFSPSLLIISWIEGEQSKAVSDFNEMVKNLADNHLIEGHQTFLITSKTKDLDGKLGEVLDTLSLDVQGNLVKVLTTRGTFKLFEPSFTSFISEWIDNCSANDYFDWHLFGQLTHATIFLINTAVRSATGLLSARLPEDIFPAFDGGLMTDNDSAYDRSIVWLSAMGGSAISVAMNLQSYRDIGQDFPSREFFAQLWDLVQSQTEIRLKMDSRKKYYVPVTEVTAAVEAQDKAYEPHKTLLGRTLHMSTRRSPRRRSLSSSMDTELMSSQSKRRRLLSPVTNGSELEDTELTPNSFFTGDLTLTPSPSISNVSLAQSEGPVTPAVTVAMLRALTRDVKKRYSVPS